MNIDTEHNIVSVIVAIVMLTAFGSIYKMDHDFKKEWNQRHQLLISNCAKLNAKYGETFTTKEGPYKGVVFEAVDVNERTVDLKVVPDVTDLIKDDKVRSFECGDLERVK